MRMTKNFFQAASLLTGVAVILATASVVTPAMSEGYRDAAMACLLENEYQPARILGVAPDGLGDYDVMVVDRDGDSWHCNASGSGYIYFNNLVF